LARHQPVEERDDAIALVHLEVGQESRCDPGVNRAEVAHRLPDALGRGADCDILSDCCHGLSPRCAGQWRSRAARSGGFRTWSPHLDREGEEMRFGLIGYGAWGRYHADAIAHVGADVGADVGAELAAIACASETSAA